MSRLSRKVGLAIPAGAVVITGCVLAGTVLASAASPSLPHRTPAQLLAGMRNARLPKAMTAILSENASLGLPALPNVGMSSAATSATSLLAGSHTVDIWYAGPRHLRVAVPVPFGETDLRVNGSQVWLWDSHGQTATHLVLPALPAGPGSGFKPVPAGKPVPGSKPASGSRPLGGRAETGRHASAKKAPGHANGTPKASKPAAKPKSSPPASAPPSPNPLAALTPIQWAKRVLAMVGPTTKVTVAGTVMVAGRAAYQLAIAPRTAQSLVSQVLIAVDAKTYLPLQVQVFARGSSGPAFQIGFTSLSFRRPAMSNFSFTPPPGAHVKTVKPPAISPGQFPGPLCGMGAPGKPGAPKPAITGSPGQPPRFLPCGTQAGLGGLTTFGSGWLTVVAIPVGQALAQPGHRAVPRPPAGGSFEPDATATPANGQAGQLPGLFGLLMKATTKVHGPWGSGRLLRTRLLSVLITSKGQVLAGAVTPAVLFADAAKAK